MLAYCALFISIDCLASSKNDTWTLASLETQSPIPTPTPTPSPLYGEIEYGDYITDGNYQYQILDEKNKLISIRKIKNYGATVMIPKKLTVIG